MAKKVLTLPTYDVDNNQTQPDQPTLSATDFKTLLDKTGADIKTFQTSTHIPELQDETLNNSGSNTIGHKSTSITADNVGDALEENALAIIGVVVGAIPDNSLTEDKMADDMKKQVGGVAEFDTVATNETNLDILRIAELDTGAADAYVVTTSGTFSRVDGNTLPFIPANDNTGASTINEDDNGVADVKKYVDGAWVALEEGDLKKFQQTSLVWNASESAFQLAPKGGAGIEYGLPQVLSANDSSNPIPAQKLAIVNKGFVFGYSGIGSSATETASRLLMDSSQVLPPTSNVLRAGYNTFNNVMSKFNNNFTYYEGRSNYAFAYSVGDDDPLKCEPKLFGTIQAAGVTLRASKTGKGYIKSLNFNGGYTTIVIDGVIIWGASVSSGWFISGGYSVIWPFNTSVAIYGDANQFNIVYEDL